MFPLREPFFSSRERFLCCSEGTVLSKRERFRKMFSTFKTKMPSIKTVTPILGGNYYHIFNRGTNRQNIFYLPKNYDYFLKLLKDFLDEYVHFLAYSLMPNHFHLVIKVKDEIHLKKGTVLSKKPDGTVLSKENGSLGIFKVMTLISAWLEPQTEPVYSMLQTQPPFAPSIQNRLK